MEQYEVYLATYGYIAIFILLFLGISGIPSPEESFMLFIGFTISQGTLELGTSLSLAITGVYAGMLAAYGIGYFLGQPFLCRFGKYIGLNDKRWNKASEHFEKHAVWAIMLGYFIPGIRQINPYMAGVSRYGFIKYLIISAIGACLWTLTYVVLGYFLGNKIKNWIEVSPFVIVWIGVGFLLIFVLISAFQIYRLKQQTD